MELLLLQDIKGIGRKNDLVIVGDGFALNFLLPRRAALVATPVVRRRYADLIKRRAEEHEQERAMQTSAVAELSGKTVKFARKASKAGKLYAAIDEDAIAAALKDQLKLNTAAAAIAIDDHIKALGTFTVHVQIGSASVPVNVLVEAEKAA